MSLITQDQIRQGAQLPGRLNIAFANYASKYNKNYTTMAEMVERGYNWATANDIINEVNARSQASGRVDPVKLKHNFTSDMSNEEFSQFLGRKERP